jgi:DNA-binding response OmpR family regulator
VAAKRIAVSYDDAVYLDLLDERLTTAGYETHLLRGQRERAAYQQLRALHPDLIILDIHLPRPDRGWHLFSRLRRDAVLSTVPMIICAAERDERACGAADAQHCRRVLLLKPFEMGDLLALVQCLLGASQERGTT